MSKLVLNDLTSFNNLAIGTVNSNSALIEDALDNTLSRDGSTPNQMEASLDMNSNPIYNLPDAVAGQSPVTLTQALNLIEDINDGVDVSITFTDIAEASQSEAEAGVITGKYMSPLRSQQHLDKKWTPTLQFKVTSGVNGADGYMVGDTSTSDVGSLFVGLGGTATYGHGPAFLDANNIFHSDLMQIISTDYVGVLSKAITGAINNGSGLIRLTVVGHGLSTNTVIAVDSSIVGVPAQGKWKITNINANTIDLQGSTFSGTYSSGGNIWYGSLDVAPYFSLGRYVKDRTPLFDDAIFMLIPQGQKLSNNATISPYASIRNFIMDPDDGGSMTESLSRWHFATNSFLGVTEQAVGGLHIMQGLIIPGKNPYEMPGSISATTKTEFQAADKGAGTINAAIGYFQANVPLGGPVRDSSKGITIYNPTSTTVNISCESSGQLVLRQTSVTTGDAKNVILDSMTTLNNGSFDVNINTAGTGANGLDAGSLAANTDYYIWIIMKNNTARTVAGLLSLSATAPTMPTGYTHKALVGVTTTKPGSATFYDFTSTNVSPFVRKMRYSVDAACTIRFPMAESFISMAGASNYTVTIGAASAFNNGSQIIFHNAHTSVNKTLAIDSFTPAAVTVTPGSMVTLYQDNNTWKLSNASLSSPGTILARSDTATPAAASAVAALSMGSAGVKVLWGTGTPNAVVTAPQGSIYTRTDGSSTSTRMYINTDGSTAWTNVTTAA